MLTLEQVVNFMKICENIKRLRKQMGLSQEALAQRVGYDDRSSIAKVETGIVDLSVSKLAAFASVFGITPAELLCSPDASCREQEKEPQFTEEQLTKDALKVGLAYDQADDGIRASVRKLLDINPDGTDAEEFAFSLAACGGGLRQESLSKDQISLATKIAKETMAE